MPTKFITTKDKSVADKLEAQGFHPVSFSYGVYVFANNNSIKLNFGADELKKVYYTNKLHV